MVNNKLKNPFILITNIMQDDQRLGPLPIYLLINFR